MFGRETASKMRAINRSQAIIEFNLDGTIIKANENFLKTMGYSLKEVKGKHHSMFVGAEYANSPEYKDFWMRLRQGKFESQIYKRFGKDGKEVWIQASYNPVFNVFGRPYKVVKFATDITEQNRTFADYKGQISAINKVQAVIHFNLDGTIIKANEAFLGTMGYTAEEVEGHHHSMFVEHHYAESNEYKEFWKKLRAGEYEAAVYKRLGKGGKEVWIRASYNPIFDLDGKPFKVVKYATNITEIIALSDATSSNVQSVAAATEEMTVSISEISKNMNLTKKTVDDIMEMTQDSGTASEQLTEKAKSMEGIVTLIGNIADKVNLLALNATIEAARAGDAGKGFAVVASEVKTLASQTATSTQKIAAEIAGIQEISNDVAKSVQSIIEAATSVDHYVGSVAGAIEEQSAVTADISSNSQKASDAVHEINACVKRV